MKKAIKENIEFITDRKILNKGVDSRQYQYSLVSVSFASSSNTIVNHFNISTIKKRIIMMNAKRSSKATLTRYAFLVPVVVALLLIFSISKGAIAFKNNRTVKALSINLKTNLLNLTANTAAPQAAKKALTMTIKKSDTIRKGGIFISRIKNDSLTYIINGVKANKSAFNALKPDNIASMAILPAASANKLMNQPVNKGDVLFIGTNDSPEGKKFMQKITGQNHSVFTIDTDVKGYTGTSRSNSSVNSFSYSSDNVSDTARVLNFVYADTDPKVKVKRLKFDTLGKKGKYETLTITRDNAPKNFNLSIAEPDSAMVLNIVPDDGNSIPGSTKNNGNVTVRSVKHKQLNFNVTTNGFYSNNQTNINHIPDKMIMIDGKEATERDLKRLPASNIESMNVQSGDDIVKKYGDKARNGVVFITTKKGD